MAALLHDRMDSYILMSVNTAVNAGGDELDLALSAEPCYLRGELELMTSRYIRKLLMLNRSLE